MAGQLVVPVNGRSGRFQINGVNQNIQEWHGTISATLGEITGFENQNVDGSAVTQRTYGNYDAQINIKGTLDTTLLPAAAGLVQGATLSSVKLFTDKSIASQCIALTLAIVESVTYDVVQNQPASTYSAVLRASGGTITLPA